MYKLFLKEQSTRTTRTTTTKEQLSKMQKQNKFLLPKLIEIDCIIWLFLLIKNKIALKYKNENAKHKCFTRFYALFRHLYFCVLQKRNMQKTCILVRHNEWMKK